MNKLNLAEKKGIASLVVLIGMLVLMVAVPVSTKLVQENQENRSKAMVDEGGGGVSMNKSCTIGGTYYKHGFAFCYSGSDAEIRTCNNGSWDKKKCEYGCETGKSVCNPKPATATCDSKGGSCIAPTASCGGTVITGVSGCSQNLPICCKVTSPAIIPSDDCKSQNGTCRTSCVSGEKAASGSSSCRPAVCCVVDTVEKIDGSCNPQFTGRNLTTRPSDKEACSAGSVYWINATGLNNEYSWECRGINTDSKANCSAKVLVNGKCGGATEKTTTSAPETNLCSKGGVTWLDKTASNEVDYKWECLGDNGGTPVPCQSKKAADCECGDATKTLVSSKPETNLCKTGDLGAAGVFLEEKSNSWAWTCFKKDICDIKVCLVKKIEEVVVSEVKLNQTSASLYEGESQKIIASILPENANNKIVIWKSSDPNVVSAINGLVKVSDGVKEKRIILVTATTSNGKSGTLTVTVNPKPTCSLNSCGVCRENSSCTNAGCLWGYNGSSQMYCYPKSSAIPTAVIKPKTCEDYAIKDCPSNKCYFNEEGVCRDKKKNRANCEGQDDQCISDYCNEFRVCDDRPVITPVNCFEGDVECVDNKLVKCVKENGVLKNLTTDCSNKKCSTNNGGGCFSEPSGVTLNRLEVTLMVGSYADLAATVLPTDAIDKTVSWSSSNSNIVTVDTNGKVVGKSIGTANIIAASKYNKDKKTTATIRVLAQTVDVCKTNGGVCKTSCSSTEISYSEGNSYCQPARCCKSVVLPKNVIINSSNFELKTGEEKTLSVTIEPYEAKGSKLIWSSSKTDVVTVNSLGVVKATKTGTSVITAKTGNGLSSSVSVTVKSSNSCSEMVPNSDSLCAANQYCDTSSGVRENYVCVPDKGFSESCNRKEQCSVDGVSQCVLGKCMKKNYCVGDVAGETKTWSGDICVSNKQYTCKNLANYSVQDFMSFIQKDCEYGCNDKSGVCNLPPKPSCFDSYGGACTTLATCRVEGGEVILNTDCAGSICCKEKEIGSTQADVVNGTQPEQITAENGDGCLKKWLINPFGAKDNHGTKICRSDSRGEYVDFCNNGVWEVDRCNSKCVEGKCQNTNGVCGNAINGGDEFCEFGERGDIVDVPETNSYYWYCLSPDSGESSERCEAKKIINGKCNQSLSGVNHASMRNPPVGGWCDQGKNPDKVVTDEYNNSFYWTCGGINGGDSSEICWVKRILDGKCNENLSNLQPKTKGDFSGKYMCITSESAALGYGLSEDKIGFDGKTFSWTCKGENGGTPKSCTVAATIDGGCNETTQKIIFDSNTFPSERLLCSSGDYEWIDNKADDGEYNWKCEGIGQDQFKECKAKRKIVSTCGSLPNGVKTVDNLLNLLGNSSSLCSIGRSESNPKKPVLDESGNFNWICLGINNDKPTECDAKRLLSLGDNGCYKASDCVTGNCLFGTCVTKDSNCTGPYGFNNGCKVPYEICKPTTQDSNGNQVYKCIIDGVCSGVQNKYFYTKEELIKEKLCDAGDPSEISLSENVFSWQCSGTKDYGENDPCTAKQNVNGECNNYLSGASFRNAPAGAWCKNGKDPTEVKEDKNNNTFYWYCGKIGNGIDSPKCEVKKIIDGECNSNAGSLDDKLCNVGETTITDDKADDDFYNWTCGSINGGTTSKCEVKKKAPNGSIVDWLIGLLPGASADPVPEGTQEEILPPEIPDELPVENQPEQSEQVPDDQQATLPTASIKPKISFKLAIELVKPNAICLSNLNKLKSMEVVNLPTGKKQTLSDVDFEVVKNNQGIGETNIFGDQVFKVAMTNLNSTFSSANNNNQIRLLNGFGLVRAMCVNNQKQMQTSNCNIDLTRSSSFVYNFSDYELVLGDMNSDGIINTTDYSIIKAKNTGDSEIVCGQEGDLNMDGVVNQIDVEIVKNSLGKLSE